ncbi:acyl-CoA dehydrogenase [Mycolicibacterium sp. XJ1819]
MREPARADGQSWVWGNPSFDVFRLPEEHVELRSVLRELCDKEIAPYAADVDQHARFPSEALAALSAGGFSAVHVPEEYGGQGADSVATCIVIEEVARADVSASLIPAVNKLGTMGLLLAGSADLKKQVLPEVGSGAALASYSLSEREAGSDAAAMRTRANAVGDDWVLNGSKCWVSNGGEATWYTVMAVTDPDMGANGISAFMVHRDDDGLSVGPKERKLGIKGSPTTELYFDDCRIPGDRIIGEPGTGFKTALRTLDHTRPTIGAQAVGLAQGALDTAITYTKDRVQFGQSINSFQAVQFMLADMAMKIESARLMVYSAAARAERGEPDLGFISAASKCLASDVAMEVTTNAVQLLGGYGYTQDFPVERMMRDAKITQIYEGTNQIQRVVMARALLHRDSPRN